MDRVHSGSGSRSREQSDRKYHHHQIHHLMSSKCGRGSGPGPTTFFWITFHCGGPQHGCGLQMPPQGDVVKKPRTRNWSRSTHQNRIPPPQPGVPQIQIQSKANIYSTGLHGTGRGHGGSRRGKNLQTSPQTWSPTGRILTTGPGAPQFATNHDLPHRAGQQPPIVTDATIEQGLPQLPCDRTLDTAPHDAEILHELNRMKHSAPGEDEVTSSMYKSLSPLGKRVLCQRLRDLWTLPTHTWSSSRHSTLGFRLHKKGCRHDIGNYRILWLISVIVRLLCRILAARVSRYCEFHHLLPDTQWGFRANVPSTRPRAQPCSFVVLESRPMPLELSR